MTPDPRAAEKLDAKIAVLREAAERARDLIPNEDDPRRHEWHDAGAFGMDDEDNEFLALCDPDTILTILALLAARTDERDKWQKAERETSDAYIRLRALIPGAFDTPHAPSPEVVRETTENALRAALASARADGFRAGIEAAAMACEKDADEREAFIKQQSGFYLQYEDQGHTMTMVHKARSLAQTTRALPLPEGW